MKPVAIVTPWFGRELKGGAEQHAWQVANRLTERGYLVDVLTTCSRSFLDDWAIDHHEPGDYFENNIRIQRFPVAPRDSVSFDRVNAKLLNMNQLELVPGVTPITENDSRIFFNNNINSTKLLSYLKDHLDTYHAFIFLPYLYGPIVNGLPLVCDKAFLQPCLHDESYAYLQEVEKLFRSAKNILFISEGERLLAERLYGPGISQRSVITGAGVEDITKIDDRVSNIGPLQLDSSRYVLYLGRRDKTKNTDVLVEAYGLFRKKHPNTRLQLVLSGPGIHSYNGRVDGVADLGLVSEGEKNALLKHCLALFQPSRNESFSRVIMEAWLFGKPVGVNKECPATGIAVKRSGGGWNAGNTSEWENLFSKIDGLDPNTIAEKGSRGRLFATENADWESVINRYENVLCVDTDITQKTRRIEKLREIHQLLPNLEFGDAISNHAISIRNYLRSCGYVSDIIVETLDDRIKNQGTIFKPNSINKNAAILYHHSIGSILTPYAVDHTGPKCLIYHNITPGRFFEPYSLNFAKLLEFGRKDLNRLASVFTISVGDSAYNASELKENGFPDPGILPISINPDQWNHAPDPHLMDKLQDGCKNILFVGRIAPNKCQDQVVDAFFQYLTMDQDARLHLVGQCEPGEPYYEHVYYTIIKHGLENHVYITGQVTNSELQAYYRTAHLFWSMSEHEGFCIPLIEAMWFDVPVLSYKTSAVPETLGKAGILFTSKNHLIQVAALAKLLVRDTALREKIIHHQRQRREDFLPQAVWPKLDSIIQRMEVQAA